MSNTFTKNFQDGNALTEAQLNTAFTTVKPSLANMALATTGSSAFEVMRSTGSDVAPEFDDIGDVLANGTMTIAGADAVGSSMSATGANAVGNNMTASGSNAVILAVDAVSGSTANLIGNAVDSSGASNNIVGQIDTSITSTAADVMFKTLLRVDGGTSATAIQVAKSALITVSTDSSTFNVVAASTISFTSTGRPVVIALIGESGGADGGINMDTTGASAQAIGEIEIRRNTTVLTNIVLGSRFNASSGAWKTFYPPSAVWYMDFVGQGTHTYDIQIKSNDDADTTININECRLIAYQV